MPRPYTHAGRGDGIIVILVAIVIVFLALGGSVLYYSRILRQRNEQLTPTDYLNTISQMFKNKV